MPGHQLKDTGFFTKDFLRIAGELRLTAYNFLAGTHISAAAHGHGNDAADGAAGEGFVHHLGTLAAERGYHHMAG